MKNSRFIISAMLLLVGVGMFFSCNDTEEKTTGFVTFGANYHIIDCMTKVTIYVDNIKIGTLENPTNSITECGEKENITKELPIGKHSYKVEIRPEIGSGCSKDIEGNFTISANKCEKIFIDYLKVLGNSTCDQEVIISPSEYKNAPADEVEINEMEIIGDCLHIKFAAGGCDGKSWIVKLIDAGYVIETYPCQRTLRLSLKDDELCKAYLLRELSFDIKSLRVPNENKVYLNVAGKGILYEY